MTPGERARDVSQLDQTDPPLKQMTPLYRCDIPHRNYPAKCKRRWILFDCHQYLCNLCSSEFTLDGGNGMRCITCGSGTRIRKTEKHDHRREVERTRVCLADHTHTFRTLERPAGSSLDNMLVRRSGDRELAAGQFDMSRLQRDVRHGVLKQMNDQELHEVVLQAKQDMELQLSTLARPLSPQERRARPGHRWAILDTDIRQAIERRLRQHGRQMPHVLYALSTWGRADRKGREGFSDARDVLNWLQRESNYPLDSPGPAPKALPVLTDTWWPPSDPPLPQRVIKRDLSTRDHFQMDRFQASIREAMLGRPEAETTSRMVAAWTLWGLVGQSDVLSTQLGVGAMECLRRIDDIAYLRWASVMKRIETVRDFRTEALALLTHPSPRLEFRVHGQPRPRPQRAIPTIG